MLKITVTIECCDDEKYDELELGSVYLISGHESKGTFKTDDDVNLYILPVRKKDINSPMKKVPQSS